MDALVRDVKDLKNQKDSSEIGIVTSIKPFAFTINGQEYSSENFVMYLPAIDRIKQWEEILGDDLEPNVPYDQQIHVDIGLSLIHI